MNDTTEAFVVNEGYNPLGTLIQGTSELWESGEIDNVTGYVHTPGSAAYGTVTDASVDFAGHVNRKIVVSPWVRADGLNEITPDVGDEFDIVTHPTLTGMHALNTADPFTLRNLKVVGTDELPQTAYVQNGHLSLVGCEVTSPSVQAPVGGEYGHMIATGCLFHDFSGTDQKWRTNHMLMEFRGCATVDFGYASEQDAFDLIHFTWVPSVCFIIGFGGGATRVRNNTTVRLDVPLGVIADGNGESLMLGSMCNAVFSNFSALWSVGVGGAYGFKLWPASKIVWSPKTKTAAEKFEFPGTTSDDFLFNETGKTLAEVGTGYVDLDADTGTGVITGSGAMAVRSEETGF
jgi:hypothetical protein